LSIDIFVSSSVSFLFVCLFLSITSQQQLNAY
jgi:hypothetical protein